MTMKMFLRKIYICYFKFIFYIPCMLKNIRYFLLFLVILHL